MIRKTGFTLIELLVVVAIIGILAAIAVPNYLQAQARAEKAQCAGNLHTLGTALALYRIDHNAYPPADGMAGRDPSPGRTAVAQGPAANGSWDGVPWVLLDLEYVKDAEVFYCPTLKKRHRDRMEHFRYAYNYSALDTGGSLGGANDIEKENGSVWLLRCLWVPTDYSFNTMASVVFPHGDYYDEEQDKSIPNVMENVLLSEMAVDYRHGERDFKQAFGLASSQ